jgi:hypothetical protein
VNISTKDLEDGRMTFYLTLDLIDMIMEIFCLIYKNNTTECIKVVDSGY